MRPVMIDWSRRASESELARTSVVRLPPFVPGFGDRFTRYVWMTPPPPLKSRKLNKTNENTYLSRLI
jgi:hypothetical protein